MRLLFVKLYAFSTTLDFKKTSNCRYDSLKNFFNLTVDAEFSLLIFREVAILEFVLSFNESESDSDLLTFLSSIVLHNDANHKPIKSNIINLDIDECTDFFL